MILHFGFYKKVTYTFFASEAMKELSELNQIENHRYLPQQMFLKNTILKKACPFFSMEAYSKLQRQSIMRCEMLKVVNLYPCFGKLI